MTARIRNLEAALAEAHALEQQARQQLMAEHPAAARQWEGAVALSQAVLNGDRSAYDRVVDESGCMEELTEMGCRPRIEWLSAHVARAQIQVQESDIVPAEEKSVTARGKLSTKKMPVGRFWEVYQDFLCGAALRTACELLAALPIAGVLVDVRTNLLNSGSGHLMR